MFSGIDEAGRGCVIGPLVLSIAVCSKDNKDKLLALGLKDSKLLSPKRRAYLYLKIKELCDVYIIKLDAKKITDYMNKKISLNEMEAEYASKLIKQTIKELKKSKMNLSEVYIDCPDTVPDRFKTRLKTYLSSEEFEGIKFVIEHKADYKYKIVSAASIVSKEEREKSIAYIKKKVGYDFGSGYSSDPTTREFLKKHINMKKLQPYLRHKWKTLDNIRNELSQAKLF